MIHINLLPWREEYREFQRKQFLFFLALGAVVSVVLVGLLHLFLAGRVESQISRNEYLSQEIAKVDKQLIEIKDVQAQKQKLLAQMQMVQRLQADRSNVVKIFDGMARTVPDGLYFTQVTRAKEDIVIQGRVESNTQVSTFMRNIEASAWLKTPVLNVIEAETSEQNKAPVGGMMFHLQGKQAFKEE